MFLWGTENFKRQCTLSTQGGNGWGGPRYSMGVLVNLGRTTLREVVEGTSHVWKGEDKKYLSEWKSS